MRIRKLLIYITAAAVSLTIATAAFAEEIGDLPGDPAVEIEETSEEEPDQPPEETTEQPEETTPDTEETTPDSEETTPEEETTTPPPDISLATDPPETTTTTAVVTTLPPAPPVTTPAPEETTTDDFETSETSETEETTTEETTTDDEDQPPVTPPIDQDFNPTPGDPDNMGTVLVILGIAAVLFVLILIAPGIIRKIKNSIIYKYD